jgi:exosortase/archaeosortase family protein
MHTIDTGRRTERRIILLAAPGIVALLAEPLQWLVMTWIDRSWDSRGAWVGALCAVLAGRALLSGPAAPEPDATRRAQRLLLATAALRLAGRFFAVNVIGASALVFDVWALGLALRLRRRPWAVDPAALAILFGFALPVEHILQRLLGFPLRLASASVAEYCLVPFFAGVERAGTVLSRAGVELSIDAPCSGAQGIVLLSVLAATLLCRRRMGFIHAATAALAVVAGALFANTLRIVALFAGTQIGAPVLHEPWHSLIGISCLAAGAMPLLVLATRRPTHEAAVSAVSPGTAAPAHTTMWVALLFSTAGLLIAIVPPHPMDVAAAAAPRYLLPRTLGAWVGEPLKLQAHEGAYFERFGGHAEKRLYRDGVGLAHVALLVRTTAPLRHLHSPDTCLIGSGHRVTRLGVRPGSVPTEMWRSVAPDGQSWRVEVSYVSSAGEHAATVSEAVWRWLHHPHGTWSLIERISPWSLCDADAQPCRAFDTALFANLDLAVAAVPTSVPSAGDSLPIGSLSRMGLPIHDLKDRARKPRPYEHPMILILRDRRGGVSPPFFAVLPQSHPAKGI